MKHFFVAVLVVFGMLFMTGPVQADLNDGLVAYYPFNGNANDESGNENHGIENGGVSYSNGVNGQAMSLNGTTGYIQTANSDSLMVEDLTIAAWIYMDSTEDVSQFISCQGTNYDTTGNYQFSINKDGLVCLNANNQGHWVASNIEYVRSSEPVSNSKWYHIAATFSNNKITYYFDGKVDSSAKYEIDHFRSTSDGIKIGDREYGGSYFNGMIDEMYIYNRALSESEIQQLYSGALTEPINKDENSLTNYSENFSSDPNFLHYKSSNADNCEVKWTEDSYYAKVFDQNNDWWCLGHSPAFNPFSTSEDFTINFDFNPVKMDWGHYPGIYFHGSPVKNKADLQANNNNGTLFRFVISYSDHNYKKLRFLFADSLSGNAKSYVTSTVPAENEWYHVTIDYLSATSTADLKVLRQDGSVFFEKKGVDAPISGMFNYLSIGEVGGGPAYGNKSEIKVDNIDINSTSSTVDELIQSGLVTSQPTWLSAQDYISLLQASINSGAPLIANEILSTLEDFSDEMIPTFILVINGPIEEIAQTAGLGKVSKISGRLKLLGDVLDLTSGINNINNAESETEKKILTVGLVEQITVNTFLAKLGFITYFMDKGAGLDDKKIDAKLPNGEIIHNLQDYPLFTRAATSMASLWGVIMNYTLDAYSPIAPGMNSQRPIYMPSSGFSWLDDILYWMEENGY